MDRLRSSCVTIQVLDDELRGVPFASNKSRAAFRSSSPLISKRGNDMLDPWIIDEIRRREEERRERPRIEIPAESPDHRDSKTPPAPPAEEDERGVIVIDL